MPHAPTATHPGATRGRRRTLLVVLAAVAAVGAAAVLYSAFSPSGQPTGGAPNQADAASPATLAARTLDGNKVTVPGNRPSVLFFFSVECGGCGPSAQALAHAQQAVGDKATFVAVDVAGYETETDVTSFLTSYQATTLAYAIDTDSRWIRTYNVNQLSTAVVLDRAGQEVFRAVEPSAEQIRAELAKVTA